MRWLRSFGGAVLATTSLLAIQQAPPVAGAQEADGESVVRADLPPPAVRVETLATGFTLPWDLAVLGDGAVLFNEHDGGLFLRLPSGVVRKVTANFSDLTKKPGLLGMVLDPGFSTNRRFYTCQTFVGTVNEPRDVRVVRWQLSRDRRSAARLGSPVVKGIPFDTHHIGCRLRFDGNGKLFVTTGDAEVGRFPQKIDSLAGKTLRVNPDGTAPSDNPYFARGGRAALVWTIGHRNPEGIALRPGTGQMWVAEMGTDRDDELNLLVKKGNYGWDPVPGYDETTPMTDLAKFPTAEVAKWSSGFPTIAPSGITFLQGSGWGPWQGAMALGLLKDQGVFLVRLGTGPTADTVIQTAQLPALDDTYGRIRTTQIGPDGALYLTTSNGSGTDKVLRVTPTG